MRRRRRMSFRPVTQTIKNQYSEKASIIAGANQNITLASTVDVGSPTKILGTEVVAGSKIFGMLISVSVMSTSGSADGDIEWYIAKTRSGQQIGSDMPDPNWTSLGLSDVRNQIWHSVSTHIGSQDSSPYKMTKYIKVPKIYQRMRSGDIIFIKLVCSINGAMNVGTIYKYVQ